MYQQEYQGSTAPRPNGGVSDASVSELLSDVLAESRRLVRAEVKLAKDELRVEAKKAGRGAGFAGAGGAVLYVALFCFAAMVVALLALAIPVWAAALITCAAFGIVGGALVAAGRREFKTIAPRQITSELREDARWLQQTTHAVKASRHVNA